MKRRQKTITSFLKKPKEEDISSKVKDVDDIVPSSSSTTSAAHCSSQQSGHTPEADKISELSKTCFYNWHTESFDIGDIQQEKIDDNTKKNILQSVLLPKQPYTFPLTKSKNQKRKFQEKWITDPTSGFPFLAYSKKKDAVYCKPCFLFYHDGIGKGSHEAPGKLVMHGFRDWKKAKETFTKHSATEYHKVCVVHSDNFTKIMSGKQKDICSQIDTQLAREKEGNRAALIPIIETILFCAEEELPLRGDGDSGPLSLEKPSKKDGKFRALLRFRACSGDENLRRHVINCSKNATYISPEIQNEIISISSSLVTEEIVARVNNSDCFSILADETMDVSATEQLSLCLRYVDLNENLPVIREDFVGFIPIYDQSAENITKVILETCNMLKLDMNKCVGQGYDGVATMAGHLSGVQTRIRETYPKARYFHCASHRLNLALSDTFSNSSVRNCLGTIKEITNFFRNSSSANNILQINISIHVPETKKKRLTRLCETRFIERHDSVLTFVELFKPIVVALEEISEKPWKISSSASNFLTAVEKSGFIVSLFVCEQLFSLTLPLSIFLQEKSLDMASAINHAKSLLKSLEVLRADTKDHFVKLFDLARTTSEIIFQSNLTIPRQSSRQMHRANPGTNSVEDYFRVAVFIPCVDSLIQNITERFMSNEYILTSFQVLLPGFSGLDKVHHMEQLSEYFENDAALASVKAEYIMWCNITPSIKKDTEVLKVLELCDKTYYRSIHFLLTVLATLPVTTCSVERSFSTMKRVKSVSRSLMTDQRLSGLAMISIHRDITIKPEKVIDKMAGEKKRRLLL